ncbi:MAG: twin-arginine translocase TatA/TatE family subunit [Planctomycetota bacterium]|nr:twin-arginine translocase TatA/TatE family subunit [Planctomycetota bacterium]
MTAIAAAFGTCIALGPPGGWEWMIILVIVLLLFGRRLPGVARSLGQGISSFKKGLNEPVDEDGKSEKKAAKSDGDDSDGKDS